MANRGKVLVDIDLEVPKEVRDFIVNNEERVASDIEAVAQMSTAFEDVTGTLRKSIKVQKSKYEDGGYIVQATAPHAHLVEFGHDQVDHNGRVVGHVGSRSYLRSAKEFVIRSAMTRFGVR